MQMVAIMSYTAVVPRGCPRSNLCMYYVLYCCSSCCVLLLLLCVCVRLLLGYEPTEQRRCTALSSKRVHQQVNHTS